MDSENFPYFRKKYVWMRPCPHHIWDARDISLVPTEICQMNFPSLFCFVMFSSFCFVLFVLNVFTIQHLVLRFTLPYDLWTCFVFYFLFIFLFLMYHCLGDHINSSLWLSLWTPRHILYCKYYIFMIINKELNWKIQPCCGVGNLGFVE